MICLESLLQEGNIVCHVLVEGIGLVQGHSLVVQQHIEGLRVGSELASLQIAPLVANGTQLAFRSVLGNHNGFRQRSLVINEQGDEDIFLVQQVRHLDVGPHRRFHLAAVHTSVTRKVQHHGQTVGLGIGHAFFVVMETRFHLALVQIEVLCAHGRSKGADRLAGCAPQARHHVKGKGKRSQSHEEAGNRSAVVHNHFAHIVIFVFVVRETNPANQVSAEQGKQYNPNTEEHFAVQDTPSISQIGHREELQGKGQFQESQAHLDAVHPVAALGRTLEPCREQGKEGEGQGQRHRKAQHADGGGNHTAGGAHFHQKEADDGSRAREAYQTQRESHQEDAEQAGCAL